LTFWSRTIHILVSLFLVRKDVEARREAGSHVLSSKDRCGQELVFLDLSQSRFYAQNGKMAVALVEQSNAESTSEAKTTCS